MPQNGVGQSRVTPANPILGRGNAQPLDTRTALSQIPAQRALGAPPVRGKGMSHPSSRLIDEISTFFRPVQRTRAMNGRKVYA